MNKKLYNFELIDRILRTLYDIIDDNEMFIKEILENCQFGAKNTVTLIPQIIFKMGIGLEETNQYGEIDQKELLEIF